MTNKDRKLETEAALKETLFVFRKKLGDQIRQKSKNLNCPISQMDTIAFISERGEPSMKEIAEYLGITPPSATTMIDVMQKNGMVARIANTKDRRTVKITITKKSQTLLKSFHKIKVDIFVKMLSKLSGDEQGKFIELLNKLIKE